jgi:hypothetical protein
MLSCGTGAACSSQHCLFRCTLLHGRLMQLSTTSAVGKSLKPWAINGRGRRGRAHKLRVVVPSRHGRCFAWTKASLARRPFPRCPKNQRPGDDAPRHAYWCGRPRQTWAAFYHNLRQVPRFSDYALYVVALWLYRSWLAIPPCSLFPHRSVHAASNDDANAQTGVLHADEL